MWREILGLEKKVTTLADVISPQRTFADVILPEDTRRQLYEALTQVQKHQLIFGQWGLGERHPNNRGLALNFAGPPGTGKSICAEALAYSLGRKLMRVRYSELESCWVGDTGKNIRAVFRDARAQDAVLLFDEGDSIAARRFSNIQAGHEREANLSVNILLKEVEEHEGVVIFATNMASNFDPAFERRIRVHVLFQPPSLYERELIWKVQIHPSKTPLADDVDFAALAQQFEATGGEIRNAVLKAAQMAAAEDGPDGEKRLRQRHFVVSMERVLAAKKVMRQTIAENDPRAFPWQEAVEAAEGRVRSLDDDLHACRTELELLAGEQSALSGRLAEQRASFVGELDAVRAEAHSSREEIAGLRGELERLGGTLDAAVEQHAAAVGALEGAQREAFREIRERLQAHEAFLRSATLLPWPKRATLAGVLLAALLLLALGALGGRLLL